MTLSHLGSVILTVILISIGYAAGKTGVMPVEVAKAYKIARSVTTPLPVKNR